ncbi:Polycomb protein Sfmbt, partial [Eumeta japonica]
VHFDGWGEEYDQWLWAHSTDMYPVGWCRAVGHRLEGPLPPQPRPPKPTKQHKQTRRPKLKRGKVKRHNAGPPQQKVNQAMTTEESSQNSDIADTKSYSPLTSASETYAEIEGRNDEAKMEVDLVPEEKQEEIPELQQSVSNEERNELVMENQEVQQMETDHRSPEVQQPPEEISPPEIPDDKYIPRLVNNTIVAHEMMSTVDPENWSEADVARFLTVNDCQTYCVNFASITGKRMLELSKDEIIELLEMKVGPSLKIFDLIKQLKCKIKTPQSRLLSSFK